MEDTLESNGMYYLVVDGLQRLQVKRNFRFIMSKMAILLRFRHTSVEPSEL